jgi:hypothetical protein
VKKPSAFVSAAAETLSSTLRQRYQIDDVDLTSFMQLELYKIIVDYTQFFMAPKDNEELTEYELLLIKHKNKQAFLSTYSERTGQDIRFGEKVYNKIRQKLA